MSEKETYLGDGVYASFDGYQIWLKTQECERCTCGHIEFEGIALEPAVLEALVIYATKVWVKKGKENG